METRVGKALLALIAVLLLITTGKDWLDLYTCGAVDKCLADAGKLQLATKFLISYLLTVLAFIASRNAFSPRDGRLLRTAFIFSLLADFSFCIPKALQNSFRETSDICGIAFFMLFQIVLIYRHTRKSESDTHIPGIHKFLVLVAAIAGAIFGARVIESTVGNVTIAAVAVYGIFLIASLVVAFRVPRYGHFHPHGAKLIRWGLVAFFIGDALVGLSMLSGEDHGAVQTLSAISKNFIWWFYVPAQLMLIAACAKPKA